MTTKNTRDLCPDPEQRVAEDTIPDPGDDDDVDDSDIPVNVAVSDIVKDKHGPRILKRAGGGLISTVQAESLEEDVQISGDVERDVVPEPKNQKAEDLGRGKHKKKPNLNFHDF